jgi:hypothetical protein
MLPPSVFLQVFLNLASAVVALLVSYYAFRFNRLVDSGVIKAMSIGFMLLGVSLTTEALTSVLLGSSLPEAFIAKRLQADESVIYLALQLLAYIVFAWGYGVGAYGKSKADTGAFSVILLPLAASRAIQTNARPFYNLAILVYLIMIVLLAFVVFQAMLISAKNRKGGSVLVLLGFVLILLGHLFLLGSVVALHPILFYEGTVIQFFGFVSLLIFLIESGRIGSA